MLDLSLLSPPNPYWGSTGAIFRYPDPRDYQLALLPENIQAREAGLPQSFYFTPLGSVPESVKINQGAVPKCVASSSAIKKSGQEFKDLGIWQRYDDDEMYRAAGGNGTNGVPTQVVLDYMRHTGARVVGTDRRFKIAAYLFAPRSYRQWRETLCAALMTTGPCVVATLLPQQFGWISSGGKTSGYHQMCLWGWEGLGDSDYAVFLNSWGSGYGHAGFVRIPWNFMEENGSLQGGYVYAYTVTDFVDGNVKPDPTPQPNPQPQPQPQPQRVTVSGEVTGGGLEFLQSGKFYLLSGEGVSGTIGPVTVTKGTDPQPKPQPDPQPDPNGLTIEIGRPAPGWLNVRAREGAGLTTAYVTVEGAGTKHTTPWYAAQFDLRLFSGRTVVVTAVAPSGKTGRLEVAV